jgi:hypothetical protein
MVNAHGTKNEWGNRISCQMCNQSVAWVDAYYDDHFILHLWCSDKCYVAWCKQQKLHCTPRLNLKIMWDILNEPKPDLEKVKMWLLEEMSFSDRLDLRREGKLKND